MTSKNMEQTYTVGDKVSVIFTDKKVDYAQGYLIDNESIKVVLNYTTIKKKKIKLNEEIELIVEDYFQCLKELLHKLLKM